MTKLSILLTVVLTSCGPSKNVLFNKTENQSLTVTSALSRCSNETSQELIDIESLSQRHAQGLLWAERFSIGRKERKIDRISREELEGMARSLLNGPLKNRSSNSFEEALLLRDELLALRKAVSVLQRLKFLECHMDNFWKLGKIQYKSFFDSLGGKKDIETSINLCSSVKGKVHCEIEAKLAHRQGRLDKFHKQYHEEFRAKFYEPRFRVSHKHPLISCSKVSKNYVLTVPVNVTNLQFNVLSRAMNKWRSSQVGLRVELRRVTDGQAAITINNMSNGPSYVDMDKRMTINLAPGHQFPLIVGHEFGHILGFPDCYFESWSQDENAFTYIEFEEEKLNLMCAISPEAFVPKKYFQQLKNVYCTN